MRCPRPQSWALFNRWFPRDTVRWRKENIYLISVTARKKVAQMKGRWEKKEFLLSGFQSFQQQQYPCFEERVPLTHRTYKAPSSCSPRIKIQTLTAQHEIAELCLSIEVTSCLSGSLLRFHDQHCIWQEQPMEDAKCLINFFNEILPSDWPKAKWANWNPRLALHSGASLFSWAKRVHHYSL